MQPNPDTRYWERIGIQQREQSRESLWRAHSDAVNTMWLASRLAPGPTQRLLKTDLFDEALAAGLYPAMSAKAHRVFGMDISATTASSAGTRYPRLLSVGADVRALPFAGSIFDGIVSISTLDHFATVDDIGVALAELYRVLRPAGHLFLTLDNLANPVVALRSVLPFGVLNRLGLVPYRVGATCGPRRLRRLLSDAGFDVVESGAILHCPRVFAVAAARMLARIDALGPQRRFLQSLLRFERLAGWRTRFLTGYFIAIVARKCG